MSSRAGYDKASGTCSGRSQPGAVALMAWSLATYEPASNLGIYVCREVRGGTVKSVHADGRALDVAFPVHDGLAHPLGHELASRLVEHADALGIQLVIFDRMVWSSKRPRWTPHTGASGPHLDHVHIEVTWAAARGPLALTVPEIERILGPLIAASEDDMFDKPDKDKLNATHWLATQANDRVGRIEALLKEQARLLEAIAEKHGVD